MFFQRIFMSRTHIFIFTNRQKLKNYCFANYSVQLNSLETFKLKEQTYIFFYTYSATLICLAIYATNWFKEKTGFQKFLRTAFKFNFWHLKTQANMLKFYAYFRKSSKRSSQKYVSGKFRSIFFTEKKNYTVECIP